MPNRTPQEKPWTSCHCVPAADPPEKPFIIPVFIPHAGCPHQCAFCNQQAITRAGAGAPDAARMESHVRSFLRYRSPRRRPVQIAFFGGNFLGMDSGEIVRLLQIAASFVKEGSVDGIRFSTRPDTLNRERLDLLRNFPVETIEIGAQSMNDAVLAQSRRGHSAGDTACAVAAVKGRGYETGIQMMVGLPGDDADGAVASGRRMADLQPDFVRIYPAVVLEHSLLAVWYRQGRYAPMTLEESVSLVKTLYMMFTEAGIAVIRMGLQATEELADDAVRLAGPYHPAFGHLVMAAVYRDRADALLQSLGGPADAVTLWVAPRRISVMRGHKNETTAYLKNRFGIRRLNVTGDPLLPDHHIRLESC